MPWTRTMSTPWIIEETACVAPAQGQSGNPGRQCERADGRATEGKQQQGCRQEEDNGHTEVLQLQQDRPHGQGLLPAEEEGAVGKLASAAAQARRERVDNDDSAIAALAMKKADFILDLDYIPQKKK